MSDIQAIKYRLVGAVVIVIGFACIWWLMLDHEAHRRVKEKQVEMPQTFTVERFDIEQPEPLHIRPDIVEPKHEEIAPVEVKATVISPPEPEEPAVKAPPPEEIPPKETPKVPEPKVPAPAPVSAEKTVTVAQKTGNYSALEANGLPEAWVLQLASLKSRENAQQLQRKLLASSYPAYVKSVETASGVSYRVLVGPKLSREKAETMARAIESEHRIKSLIIKFQPGYEQ